MLRISGLSITTKLLGMNLLILLAVGGIAGSNLFVSRQVEETLVPLISGDVTQIIQNAALARELNMTFVELNLILNTFTEHRDLLDTKGNELLEKLRSRMNFPGQSAAITKSLNLFYTDIKELFDECRNVSDLLQKNDISYKSIEEQLNSLDITVADMIVKGKSSGREYEQSSLEQISAIIPDIRNMLLQVRLHIAELTRSYMGSDITDGDEQPVFTTLRDVSSSLQTVITAGAELVPVGNRLIASVQQYHQQISDYHKTLQTFQQEFEKMSNSQKQVMAVMQEIDNKITGSTGQIQKYITKNLRSSRRFTLGLSFGIGVIVICIGFFAFWMIRPLGELAKIAAKLAKGDIDCTIHEPRTRDEIGMLFRVFKQLVDATRETTKVVEEIADGNLGIEVKERSEKDRLMQAMNRMISRLKEILYETKVMISSVEKGTLNVRGNAEAFEGGWRELVTGVNNLIDGLGSAVSEKTALGTEMELAKRIQTVLLPKKPEISGYDISASCEPSEEVGGDYYDVISVGDYDWIVIGDVSGHGVTAGLVMMMVQTAIHTVLVQNCQVPPSELLWVINRTIYENIAKMDESKHMTIVVLACGKDGTFCFSGLHEDMLIRRAGTGKVENIGTDGMWIGLEPDISGYLSDGTLRMESGDCMVLYTDGITEAVGKDREFFGEKRLKEIVEKFGIKSAAAIHNAILDSLTNYEKPDDVTLFVMKRL